MADNKNNDDSLGGEVNLSPPLPLTLTRHETFMTDAETAAADAEVDTLTTKQALEKLINIYKTHGEYSTELLNFFDEIEYDHDDVMWIWRVFSNHRTIWCGGNGKCRIHANSRTETYNSSDILHCESCCGELKLDELTIDHPEPVELDFENPIILQCNGMKCRISNNDSPTGLHCISCSGDSNF